MKEYGVGDSSFQAAGGEVGIRKLVDAFYHQMEILPEAQHIRSLHKADLDTIKDKLSVFLMGWLGGPRNYAEKYGSISIPGFHQYLDIKEAERDAWLLCMQEALKDQGYDAEFKEYLIFQLGIPAERVRYASQMVRQDSS